jgi:hypothetical protein
MSGASDECCGFYDAFLLSRLSFFPFFHFTVSFSSLCYRISGVMRRRRRGGGGGWSVVKADSRTKERRRRAEQKLTPLPPPTSPPQLAFFLSRSVIGFFEQRPVGVLVFVSASAPLFLSPSFSCHSSGLQRRGDEGRREIGKEKTTSGLNTQRKAYFFGVEDDSAAHMKPV